MSKIYKGICSVKLISYLSDGVKSLTLISLSATMVFVETCFALKTKENLP